MPRRRGVHEFLANSIVIGKNKKSKWLRGSIWGQKKSLSTFEVICVI